MHTIPLVICFQTNKGIPLPIGIRVPEQVLKWVNMNHRITVII